MKQLTVVTCILLLLVAQGCAKRPNNIKAADISPLAYSSHDCETLSMEMNRVQGKLTPLVKGQTTKANADAALMTVGLVIFWPALLAMPFTGNDETDIATLKGEYEAIDKAMTHKNCLTDSAVAAKDSTAPPSKVDAGIEEQTIKPSTSPEPKAKLQTEEQHSSLHLPAEQTNTKQI